MELVKSLHLIFSRAGYILFENVQMECKSVRLRIERPCNLLVAVFVYIFLLTNPGEDWEDNEQL